MSPLPSSSFEMEGGVIQLRYLDHESGLVDLNAAELADAIQGLVELTSQMAKDGMLGDGAPPELRIRPPKEGSFVLEGVIQWITSNPEVTNAALGTTAGGVLLQSINAGIKVIRGVKVKDVQPWDGGMVKVAWSDGDVQTITSAAWESLNGKKRKTRRALAKIMAPMGDNADELEVRAGAVGDDTEQILAAPPQAVADVSDYREAVNEPDDIEEATFSYTEEARLESIDFREGAKWRVRTADGTRSATMEDNEFQLALDRGFAIHKTDLFEVTIREDVTITNGRKSRKYALVAVRVKRRGDRDGDGTT